MKKSNSQSLSTSLLLSALLLSLMIFVGIIFASNAGVNHTETENQYYIASDRETGTVKW